MISFEEAKKILNNEGEHYTDEEVKFVMNIVGIIVKADIDRFHKVMAEKKNAQIVKQSLD